MKKNNEYFLKKSFYQDFSEKILDIFKDKNRLRLLFLNGEEIILIFHENCKVEIFLNQTKISNEKIESWVFRNKKYFQNILWLSFGLLWCYES